jgi:prolyl oligopeptidase
LAVDPKRPARTGWRSVITEHPADVLDSVTLVGGELLTSYLSGGATRLERFDRRGKSRGQVQLPTVGTSGGFSGHVEGNEAFFDFESLVHPRTIHRLDPSSARTTVWAEAAPGFAAPSDWAVHADATTSRDGTRIPYLTAVPSVRRNGAGPRPTVLYGYGGFNVSVLPRFSRAAYLLLERGATYVQAVLRGGGELGEHWHQAGRLDKKQNTFDDFIAVAESLIDRGTTAPDRLGIWGRSNGGLLVCAVLAQRPELFRAAVASVPLTDMLRFHRFLLGKLWTTEYGSPDEPDAFQWLAAYSPYHNVRDGVPYPAVLLTTASHDSRVHPMHARKMAASLQHASSSGHPVLLRSETEAGHGAGKPMSKVVDESTDVLAFLLWQLAP